MAARGVRGLAVGLALLLAGCGDTPAGDALRRIGGGAGAPPIAVQGPALVVSGTRQPVVMRPLQQSGTRQLWRDDGNAALATEGARIVATAGFGQILSTTRFDGPDPLVDPRALLAAPGFARRSVDLQGADRDADSMRFGVALDCTLRARPDAGWLLVEERCTGNALAFTNRFWAEPESGVIRRSDQWVGDALAPLTVEIVPP
jgi:hypothetical protein